MSDRDGQDPGDAGREDGPPGRSVRAFRGAITAAANEREAILAATVELLEALTRQNTLGPDDVISAVFTVTEDLDAVFPAEAARRIGWSQVPLLCAREIPVPGALGRCIRVLLHAETALARTDVQHVYLKEATRLRPDLHSAQ